MNVAIIGGGVAGLATAISLDQLGMSVALYERRSSVRHLGAGVICWPNASFVLEQLGMLEELRSVAGRVSAMRRRSKDGQELGLLNIARIDEAIGYPSLSVLRSNLMQTLLRRVTSREIPVQYGAHAVSIERGPSGLKVRFADGTAITCEIVVGADGRMESIARQFVAPGTRPVFQGFTNWIGIHRFERPRFHQMEILDYWGVGARFGIVPVSENTAYWAGGVASTTCHSECDGQRLDQLRNVFDGWPSAISEVIANASESNVRHLPLYDHDSVSTWHRDNVIMIGDAAHAALPTSGQGVAQALEDAWWLAREFAAAPCSPETAMAAFTRRRLEKTTRIMQAGRQLAKTLFSSDPDICERRDRQAEQTDYANMASGMAAAWSAGLPLESN
ncbi:FAD-dependent oxidoreductase [Roseiconus nitratireducens]|uniref:FAD-dependent oxidoreductase n=1 Tax=Roseiconus nitratireducens TaxID=2605748 RepID=A0A5M6CZA9_9BACT|nr:FAD-dependent oxidoreductase [Roseiconus nitratireducens]KAA5539750.1 FAD-dependent oxidoreductase [Roseiconus nitratireducens]